MGVILSLPPGESSEFQVSTEPITGNKSQFKVDYVGFRKIKGYDTVCVGNDDFMIHSYRNEASAGISSQSVVPTKLDFCVHSNPQWVFIGDQCVLTHIFVSGIVMLNFTKRNQIRTIPELILNAHKNENNGSQTFVAVLVNNEDSIMEVYECVSSARGSNTSSPEFPAKKKMGRPSKADITAKTIASLLSKSSFSSDTVFLKPVRFMNENGKRINDQHAMLYERNKVLTIDSIGEISGIFMLPDIAQQLTLSKVETLVQELIPESFAAIVPLFADVEKDAPFCVWSSFKEISGRVSTLKFPCMQKAVNVKIIPTRKGEVERSLRESPAELKWKQFLIERSGLTLFNPIIGHANDQGRNLIVWISYTDGSRFLEFRVDTPPYNKIEMDSLIDKIKMAMTETAIIMVEARVACSLDFKHSMHPYLNTGLKGTLTFGTISFELKAN